MCFNSCNAAQSVLPISVGCRRDVLPLALLSLNLEISIRHDFFTLNRQQEGISIHSMIEYTFN